LDSDFEDTRSFSNKIKCTNKRTSNMMGSRGLDTSRYIGIKGCELGDQSYQVEH